MQLRNWAPELNISLSAFEGPLSMELLCMAARVKVVFHPRERPQEGDGSLSFPRHVLVTPDASWASGLESAIDLDVRGCCVDTVRFANDDSWFTKLSTLCMIDSWWESLWPPAGEPL